MRMKPASAITSIRASQQLGLRGGLEGVAVAAEGQVPSRDAGVARQRQRAGLAAVADDEAHGGDRRWPAAGREGRQERREVAAATRGEDGQVRGPAADEGLSHARGRPPGC
jgi:hypothetical protein